jgi:hypothetical protein
MPKQICKISASSWFYYKETNKNVKVHTARKALALAGKGTKNDLSTTLLLKLLARKEHNNDSSILGRYAM